MYEAYGRHPIMVPLDIYFTTVLLSSVPPANFYPSSTITTPGTLLSAERMSGLTG